MAETSPVIKFPTDPERQAQLRRKLEEYKSRLESRQFPESQSELGYRVTILETLLANQEVNTWNLSRELASKFKDDFDVRAFERSCAVIDDYCQTGGQHVCGGTGLK